MATGTTEVLVPDEDDNFQQLEMYANTHDIYGQLREEPDTVEREAGPVRGNRVIYLGRTGLQSVDYVREGQVRRSRQIRPGWLRAMPGGGFAPSSED